MVEYLFSIACNSVCVWCTFLKTSEKRRWFILDGVISPFVVASQSPPPWDCFPTFTFPYKLTLPCSGGPCISRIIQVLCPLPLTPLCLPPLSSFSRTGSLALLCCISSFVSTLPHSKLFLSQSLFFPFLPTLLCSILAIVFMFLSL